MLLDLTYFLRTNQKKKKCPPLNFALKNLFTHQDNFIDCRGLSIIMKLVFIFVVLFVIDGSVLAGTCSNNSTSTKMPDGNTKCPQYNSNSCCTSHSTFIKESCTIDDGCKLGQTCFDLINLVQCANECRPDMSVLTDSSSGNQFNFFTNNK